MSDEEFTSESDELKSGEIEGYDGPFGSGYRCSVCAVMIEGPQQFLDQHRAWHDHVG